MKIVKIVIDWLWKKEGGGGIEFERSIESRFFHFEFTSKLIDEKRGIDFKWIAKNLDTIFSLRINFLKNFGNSKLIDVKKGGRFQANRENFNTIFSFRINFLKNFGNSKLIDLKKRGGELDFKQLNRDFFISNSFSHQEFWKFEIDWCEQKEGGGGVDFERSIFSPRIYFLKNFGNSKLINVKKGAEFERIVKILTRFFYFKFTSKLI